jgi:L-cystine transport system permease protein
MLFGINFEYLARVFPKLMTALPVTLLLFAVSGVLLGLFSVVITAVRVRKTVVLYQLVSVLVSFIRSTPLLLQLFVIYYGLPVLLKPVGIDINSWSQLTYAVIALVLHNGVYLSELMLPAYLSISKGQFDAAHSIGLTETQTFLRIIFPQVVPIILPGLGNILVDLIKDTSVLFTIGMVDLMGRAKIIIAGDYGIGKLEVYIAIAIVYWVISAIIDWLMAQVEKHHQKYSLNKGIRVNAAEREGVLHV